MGILKDIIKYLKKKTIIEDQLYHFIINYDKYDPSNKTIVFVSGNIPTPDKDSGSNRFKEIILSFKEQGYNCIICTKKAPLNDKYTNYFRDLEIIIYTKTNQYKNYFTFLKSIPKVDYIWYNGPGSFGDNFKKMCKNLPNSKSIFDMVDIHFLRYERAIKQKPIRISYRKRYRKYFNIETRLAQKANYIITISDIEKEFMSKYIDSDKLITISNIHYPKIKKEETLSFEERKDLLFIGSTHTPNIDAIHYLYHDIMPIVWKKLPEIKVNIIGNVIEKISDINNPQFIFKGYVPDIESFLTSSKIMVAPLRYGAGVKGKVGQAFEYYLPVVTTSIGAEGMKLINKKNALINDDKESFASAIIDLYTDKNLWLQLQNNSEQSLEPFSREKLSEQILTKIQ